MLRGLILILIAGGIVLVVLPIVVSSQYIDERGVTLPGRIRWKSEDVTVHSATWKRTSTVTIQYLPPDTSVTSFLAVPLAAEQYDGFHVGEQVSVRYLLAKDIPNLPLAKTMREVHALPMAHLAGPRPVSRWELYFPGRILAVACGLGGLIVCLIVWRRLGFHGFGWAVATCVLVAIAVMMVGEFPLPTPRPAVEVRQASGKVKSINRINRLFDGTRTRGLEMLQPVDVVGVEFVPEGRSESVMAVDLIDSGSVAGLHTNSMVRVDYESRTPRTAYVQTATRKFVNRNLLGGVGQIAAYLLAMGIIYLGCHYLSLAFNRRRPSGPDISSKG